MTRACPSTLLRNLHCSLPVIARLYKDASAASRGSADRFCGVQPTIELPLSISTVAEGEAVLDFFCQELGIGASSLRQWRSGLVKATQHNWWGDHNGGSKQRVGRDRVSPSHDDVFFLRSVIDDLKAVVSPFLTLVRPRSKNPAPGTSFVATRRIQPGVFLLSLPTSAIFFSQPPPASDPLTSFFLHLEEMVGQLVECCADTPSDESRPSHAGYVEYLKRSVTPCNNLPFLELDEINCLLKDSKVAEKKGVLSPTMCNNRSISPAVQLWEYFHHEMAGLPLSAYLRERLSKEEYAWWVSLVLSRRAGSATLIPVLDKLNHHPEPNCYYTMATEESFCGIDVFDNLLAGVSSDLLYDPYLHTFSIREIQEGEELTLCYASPMMRSNPRRSAGAPNSAGESMSVLTGEGRAAWQVQWGFIPETDSPYSSNDLREVATIVTERRVNLRQKLFPPER